MVLLILENLEVNLNLENKMTETDKLIDEYLEATKGKNHDMDDIMRDSDFLLELWKKEQACKDS